MNDRKRTFLHYYLPGVIILLFGLLLLFRSYLVNPSADLLWASDFDTPLMVWIMSWGFHVLVDLNNPAGFFQANSFFPQANTLAYSDSLLGLQVFFIPLRLLGLSTLPALYLTLALTVIVTGLITLLLLRRVAAFSTLQLCLILFGAFFSMSATGYLIHYQLFGFYWIAPFVLSLFLFLRDRHTGFLVIVCASYFMGTITAVYLAPIMLVFAVFLALPMVFLQYTRCGRGYFRTFLGWKNLLVVLVSAGLLYWLQLRPYFLIRQVGSSTPIDLMILLSATPQSLLQKSQYSIWYQASSSIAGAWESSYFPGYLLLGLALAFIVQKVWQARARKKAKIAVTPTASVEEPSPQDELFLAYMLLFLITCLLFSLGPYLKKDIATGYSIPLPFLYLSKIIPGLAHLRAPGRFGMMIGLPLSVLGVYFLQQLNVRREWKKAISGIVLTLLVIESIPNFPVYPFNPDPQGTYHWLAGQIPMDSPLLELPLSRKGEDENPVASQQLVGSTIHWARLASGYGAMESPEYRVLADLDKLVQLGRANPMEILKTAQRYHFEWVLIHQKDYPTPVMEQWRAAFHSCAVFPSPNGDALLIKIDACP